MRFIVYTCELDNNYKHKTTKLENKLSDNNLLEDNLPNNIIATEIVEANNKKHAIDKSFFKRNKFRYQYVVRELEDSEKDLKLGFI